MAWVILLLSGILEAVWAIALAKSDGFTKAGATVTFVIASILSLVGLGIAMKDLPTGTAYAVWTATGAALTVSYSMVTGTEKATVARLLLILGIVACVVGLKAVS